MDPLGASDLLGQVLDNMKKAYSMLNCRGSFGFRLQLSPEKISASKLKEVSARPNGKQQTESPGNLPQLCVKCKRKHVSESSAGDTCIRKTFQMPQGVSSCCKGEADTMEEDHGSKIDEKDDRRKVASKVCKERILAVVPHSKTFPRLQGASNYRKGRRDSMEASCGPKVGKKDNSSKATSGICEKPVLATVSCSKAFQLPQGATNCCKGEGDAIEEDCGSKVGKKVDRPDMASNTCKEHVVVALPLSKVFQLPHKASNYRKGEGFTMEADCRPKISKKNDDPDETSNIRKELVAAVPCSKALHLTQEASINLDGDAMEADCRPKISKKDHSPKVTSNIRKEFIPTAGLCKDKGVQIKSETLEPLYLDVNSILDSFDAEEQKTKSDRMSESESNAHHLGDRCLEPSNNDACLLRVEACFAPLPELFGQYLHFLESFFITLDHCTADVRLRLVEALIPRGLVTLKGILEVMRKICRVICCDEIGRVNCMELRVFALLDESVSVSSPSGALEQAMDLTVELCGDDPALGDIGGCCRSPIHPAVPEPVAERRLQESDIPCRKGGVGEESGAPQNLGIFWSSGMAVTRSPLAQSALPGRVEKEGSAHHGGVSAPCIENPALLNLVSGAVCGANMLSMPAPARELVPPDPAGPRPSDVIRPRAVLARSVATSASSVAQAESPASLVVPADQTKGPAFLGPGVAPRLERPSCHRGNTVHRPEGSESVFRSSNLRTYGSLPCRESPTRRAPGPALSHGSAPRWEGRNLLASSGGKAYDPQAQVRPDPAKSGAREAALRGGYSPPR
ncbi:unnamed protein product [Ixodes pacificus]